MISMKMENSYIEALRIQLKNSAKPGINFYLNWIYQLISREFEKDSEILEIGAGAGISSKYLHGLNVLRTDILGWEENLIVGNINATSLHWDDNKFDGVIAVDCLHHLCRPADGIIEMIRVSKVGATLVFIEPYVSFFSFPIFKLFHTERTTWNLKFDFKKDMVSNLPEDGEQSIAQSLFESQDNLIKLRELASKNFEFSIDHISPVSFFATGGLTRPLPVSSGLIKIITRIESYIPKKLLKYCASRALIVIRIIK